MYGSVKCSQHCTHTRFKLTSSGEKKIEKKNSSAWPVWKQEPSDQALETQNNTAAITVNNSLLEVNGLRNSIKILKDHQKHQIEIHKLK